MDILINVIRDAYGLVRRRRKGIIMYKLQEIISLVLLFTVLPTISNADPVIWTSGSYEIRSNNEWYHIIELQTYNDVTVKMYQATTVNSFSMYDNSNLTMYGGGISELNLYNNATASFFGGNVAGILYIDPSNAGWVKLYAYNVTYIPYNPNGEGILQGYWLDVPYGYFDIDIRGQGAYSHVQIVPEPATLVLLALGSLAVLRRRRS